MKTIDLVVKLSLKQYDALVEVAKSKNFTSVTQLLQAEAEASAKSASKLIAVVK